MEAKGISISAIQWLYCGCIKCRSFRWSEHHGNKGSIANNLFCLSFSFILDAHPDTSVSPTKPLIPSPVISPKIVPKSGTSSPSTRSPSPRFFSPSQPRTRPLGITLLTPTRLPQPSPNSRPHSPMAGTPTSGPVPRGSPPRGGFGNAASPRAPSPTIITKPPSPSRVAPKNQPLHSGVVMQSVVPTVVLYASSKQEKPTAKPAAKPAADQPRPAAAIAATACRAAK